MPKYSFSRRIQLQRYFPQLPYESAEFSVSEVETMADAVLQVEEWIKFYIAEKKQKLEEKKSFTEKLDDKDNQNLDSFNKSFNE